MTKAYKHKFSLKARKSFFLESKREWDKLACLILLASTEKIEKDYDVK